MTRRRTPSVLAALDAALESAPPADQDTATVALAKRYALELDDAAVISTRMTKALRRLHKAEDVDDDLFEQFEALAARIEETHVAALIGPKLLAALEQLNMTPASRKAVVGGAEPPAGKSTLDELRERRESRGMS